MPRTVKFAPRIRKYRNKPTGGYASKRESNRATELGLLVMAGKIRNLRQQVEYELIPAQYRDGKCIERSCKYIADFVYTPMTTEISSDNVVVEDAKGYREPVYRIKRKLMLHVHGIKIREV